MRFKQTPIWIALSLSLLLSGSTLPVFSKTPEVNTTPSLKQEELKAFGFNQSKTQPQYLLLDFFSASCGVCQQTEPIFKEMQKRMKNYIQFARVDADQTPKQMTHFGVEGTPGYLLFNDAGKPIYKMQRYISLEILYTNLQRYTGQLKTLALPESLMKQSTILTTDELKAPHYTLVAIHPDDCEPCKKQLPFLNGMALAASKTPKLNIVTWNPKKPEVAPLLKQLHWSDKQSYVFIDPEHHELVTVSGNPDPKSFWQTLSMLMDDGLEEDLKLDSND